VMKIRIIVLLLRCWVSATSGGERRQGFPHEAHELVGRLEAGSPAGRHVLHPAACPAGGRGGGRRQMDYEGRARGGEERRGRSGRERVRHAPDLRAHRRSSPNGTPMEFQFLRGEGPARSGDPGSSTRRGSRDDTVVRRCPRAPLSRRAPTGRTNASGGGTGASSCPPTRFGCSITWSSGHARS